MKQETINKRIMGAIERLHPNETDYVKGYLLHLTKITFNGLMYEHEIDDRTGKEYSASKNLEFAISITLDDGIETKFIIEDARKRESELKGGK